MSNRRVVVTGIGLVSSLGIGTDANWKNLLAGVSGVSNITKFDRWSPRMFSFVHPYLMSNGDLIVKDPNVSRQHARIVRHQGQYWMVDMGSTNGIEFQGGRVDRRPIHEGDVFRICDHEIAFTFR